MTLAGAAADEPGGGDPNPNPNPNQVTLAQLLTSLEEGRLVDDVAAEREAGVRE